MRADYRIVSINVPSGATEAAVSADPVSRFPAADREQYSAARQKHHTVPQLVKSAAAHVSRRVMGIGRPRSSTSVERRLQSASAVRPSRCSCSLLAASR